MPDKKLTDNDIVKALECCVKPTSDCGNCPLYVMGDGDCVDKSKQGALNLINRLQAENEKKDRAFENLIEVARLWKEKYNTAKKELFDKTEQLKTAKAEAYKEFAERLKKEINVRTTFSKEQDKNVLIYIDNLLKELVGENDAR